MGSDTKKLDDEKRWAALMVQSQNGNANAYNLLLSELSQVCEKYIQRKFGEIINIEDCVQECLLALHHARHTYDPKKAFRPWFFTIVKHKTIDVLRRVEKHKTNVSDQQELEISEYSHVDLDRIIDGQRLMLDLSDEQRQAIALTQYVGMTANEASVVIGVTETTLKARLKRGLDKIKKRWQLEETNR